MLSRLRVFKMWRRAQLLLLAALALFLVHMEAAPQRPAAPRSTVRFIVTDGWGVQVRGARIQVIHASGDQKSVYYPEDRSFVAEPGTYTVVVSADVFLTLATQITVGHEDMFKPLCMRLSEIEAPASRAPSLAGKIGKSFLNGDPNWVRLVGLYCDFNGVAMVDKAGSFFFSRLQPGRYQLMLFAGGELRTSRLVDVRLFETNVKIE